MAEGKIPFSCMMMKILSLRLASYFCLVNFTFDPFGVHQSPAEGNPPAALAHF
jgi:hypothetical protein